MSSAEQYIVSARKYRPGTFQTVVGQKALTATLKNAILGGKLAQAYLFCGPRGVGKTSCARIFAKTINCLNPTSEGEACGECESCKAIERGNSFNLIELDAASNNSVDDIRNINEQVNVPAQNGRYRVFIIDEVHMLSNAAFNAFLKTLEEPPKNVVFILATTERHKVIPTILSRCQVYDFRRITVNDIIDHLEFVAEREGVSAEREALGVIALKADGAMRDALSIFDQVVASTHGNITYEGTIRALNVLDQDYYFRLIETFRKGDVAEALLTFKEITDKGFDAQFFINGLAEHIRNLMVVADPRTSSLLQTSEEWEKKYVQQAPGLPVEWYYMAIKILNDTDYNYRTSSNKRLLVELALIRLSRLLSGGIQMPAPVLPTSAGEGVPQGESSSQAGNANYTSGKAPFVTPDSNRPQTVREEKKEVKPVPVVKETKTSSPTDSKPLYEQERSTQSIRAKSFRLTSERNSGEKKEDDIKDRAFTAEEFETAWEEYSSSHPEQRILVSAMRTSKPVQTGATSYRFMVEHPAQKQAFDGAFGELMDFLRKRLGNRQISLAVEISQEETQAQGLPPKEFLKLAVEENPELAKFLKAVEAELE